MIKNPIRDVTYEKMDDYLQETNQTANEEEMLDSRYRRGYQRMPESPEEVQTALAIASVMLAEEPWE